MKSKLADVVIFLLIVLALAGGVALCTEDADRDIDHEARCNQRAVDALAAGAALVEAVSAHAECLRRAP
jgi:hypothetical protein